MSELFDLLDKKEREFQIVIANIFRFGKMSETTPRNFHKSHAAWLVLQAIDEGRKILDELEEKFAKIQAVVEAAQAAATTADPMAK